MQVTGLVTTPGGSWDVDQVLWKLPVVVVQVTGLVTTPGGSLGGDQVLLKLPGVAGIRASYNTWRKLGW